MQRVNYAKIELFKNYSFIGDNHKQKTEGVWYSANHDSFINELNEPVSNYDYKNPSLARHSNYYYIPHIKNKKALWFGEIYPLKSAGVFYTLDDDKIKKYYVNPFASVEIRILERSLRIKGDTLILKTYALTKSRLAQTKYYKKKTSSSIISINLKTGNFRLINNEGKGASFRTNVFTNLQHIFKNLFIYEPPTFKNKKLDDKFIETFDDREIVESFIRTLGFKVKKRTLREAYNNFMNFFVEKKRIKVPDNFFRALENFYPTEKYLKKNDRKLMVSILDMYGIKSKITNRIVHQHPDIHIRVLAELCNLFGKDFPKYLCRVHPEWFNPSSELFNLSDNNSEFNTKRIILTNSDFANNLNLNELDKQKIVTILNEFITGGHEKQTHINSMLMLIVDHLNMLHKIREYDTDKKLEASTWDEFREEHDEFSKLVAKIRKAWTIEYQFNQDMLSDMEKPVTVEINLGDESNPQIGSITFYPKVLKIEEEYVEEGEFMHHCVASYADKEKSVIISLRTEDSSDRITCEFDGQSGVCIQARHFCNKPIPGDFDLALDTIKAKTNYYARRGMLHHTHKKRVPLVINNIEVKAPIVEPTFNEHLFPY